ncbi:hypothetical protein [Chlamydia sp.]|uniref:hypothetical protein n=1 Tax=Chlamydia sp. TaxID=35827 RepID=UPI0025B91771|nr:hypothetical protein [Chlamydia sp.]MBQ8498287.1 hypothetical protein [Chlamydia sp.]
MKRVILCSLLFASFPFALKASLEKKTLSRAAQLRERRKEFLHVSGKPSPRYALKKRALEAKRNKPSISWITYSNLKYSFLIPNNWQCIDDKTQLPDKLDALFIGKGAGSLTPTINSAHELINKTEEAYIQEILEYHRANEMTLESSIFTHIQAPSGKFTIIKTEKNTSWGRVFCLQSVAVIDRTAYILTSTSTVEDYPNVSLALLKAASSFQLSEKEEAARGDAILEKALQDLQKGK